MTDFMRFDIDEFNDNLTGNFILDRIILVKNSCRWRPWQLLYIRLVLTLIRIQFLATQCIYVFLPILKSNSDYFHIHYSPIGLSDGKTMSSARYELRLYMYMWIPISIRNKVLLYVNWLFANFLVWYLGKVCLAQVFVRVRRFCPLNVIKNSLIKRTKFQMIQVLY